MSDKNLTVVVNGSPRDLFMSFGMLRELVTLVGDLERLHFMMLDADSIVSFMNITLTERDKTGRPTPEGAFDAAYCDIDDEDREALLKWVTEHVLGFFMSRVEALEQTLTGAAPKLAALNSSMDGLKDSVSKTPAAGRSKQSRLA